MQTIAFNSCFNVVSKKNRSHPAHVRLMVTWMGERCVALYTDYKQRDEGCTAVALAMTWSKTIRTIIHRENNTALSVMV